MEIHAQIFRDQLAAKRHDDCDCHNVRWTITIGKEMDSQTEVAVPDLSGKIQEEAAQTLMEASWHSATYQQRRRVTSS